MKTMGINPDAPPPEKNTTLKANYALIKIKKCKRKKRREHQGFPATAEARREAWNRFPLRVSKEDQSSWHLDLGLLGFLSLRE